MKCTEDKEGHFRNGPHSATNEQGSVGNGGRRLGAKDNIKEVMVAIR